MENVEQILRDNILGAVATLNEDGSPWISPIHVFSDTDAVYWFSKETAVHSQNVARDPRVSVTLFSTDMSQGPKGLYINGAAEVLGVDDTTEAKALIEAKIGKIPANFIEATAYKLKIGELNRGQSTGNCWYFYT